MDFNYKDGWYPLTDGLGFSLVVANEGARTSAWGTRLGWRQSARSTARRPQTTRLTPVPERSL